ncbi:MAG: hypothetical protein ACK5WZ_04205 [Pseudobdellovibrionaceae bacterium]|jgi:hypothetical protein
MRYYLILICFGLFLFGACTQKQSPSTNLREIAAETNPSRLELAAMPGNMRFYPFFIEANPSNTDPRSGNLNSSTPPISSDQLQRIMNEGLAPLMFDLSGVYFSGNQNLNELVLLSAQHIQTAIIDILEKVDANLSNEDAEYSIVLLPWKQSDPFYYTSANVQVTGRVSGSSAFGKPPRFYDEVESNLRELQTYAFNTAPDAPTYFLGSMMNIHLKKNSSSIKTQILFGLNPNEIPFEQSNEQVRFTHVVIPPRNPVTPAPVMSVQIHQYVRAARTRPNLQIEFGPLKGWNSQAGNLKILLGENRSLCDGRSSSTPYLKGTLADKAVSNPTLASALRGRPVNFHVYNLKMDLFTSSVTTMNLAIGAGFRIGNSRLVFGCANVTSVDQQFQEEVNKTIQSQFQQFQTQDPALVVQKLLNQKRGRVEQ